MPPLPRRLKADGLVLLTDWPECHALDWSRIANSMTGDLVLDTHNTLDHQHLADIAPDDLHSHLAAALTDPYLAVRSAAAAALRTTTNP